MDQNQKPILLEDKKFALYGKPTEGGRGAPKMQFGVWHGNPNITVFTNDPADPEKKPIRAAMDPVIWGGFIQTLIEAANAEPNFQRRLLNRKGPPQKTFVDSMTIVGKDGDGVVYIAIQTQNRPTKKILILPGIYADLADDQGNPVADPEKSKTWALGLARTLDAQMQAFMRETYEPAQPPQGAGNRSGGQYGGGGSYNSGGGQPAGGQGGGAPSGQGGDAPGAGGASFEDDLPL